MPESKYPKSIIKAIHEVMSNACFVKKDGENQFHKFKYASEISVLKEFRPAMLKAGLIVLPSITDITGPDVHGNTNISVQYTLAHIDGDIWPEKIIAMGSGNDMSAKGKIGDKGLYKAITGANKYFLFKLFQIPTGDDPYAGNCGHDANTSKNKPENQSYGAEASSSTSKTENPSTDTRDVLRSEIKALAGENYWTIGEVKIAIKEVFGKENSQDLDEGQLMLLKELISNEAKDLNTLKHRQKQENKQ